LTSPYPQASADRDRWILGLRGPRNPLDLRRSYAAFLEEEVSESGAVVSVATLLLTNHECPWRCLMCDLWQNTLPGDTAPGAIPEQIRLALSVLPAASRIKLYNAGSFFDAKAIPPEDDEVIARLLEPFDRVIVESHPALVGDRCWLLQKRLGGRLEVAMGLETVHPEVLPRLNKRMTLARFRRAADFLRGHGIALRSFVLVGLPWVAAEETPAWTLRAIEFAFDCGSGAVSLIPTRAGNGAMKALQDSGDFRPPSLGMLESAAEQGLALRRGRVFADLWNLETFSRCSACFPARAQRLREMNLRQAAPARIDCDSCGATA
jgi:radical SAM enzyme (TIGR01210 family)